MTGAHEDVAILLTEVPPRRKATEHYAELARFMSDRGQPPTFGMGVLVDLQHELGDFEAVWRWVIEQATELDKPIFCNVAGGKTSRTVTIAPPGWSEERLAGYVAGYHSQIEAMFGKVSAIESRGHHDDPKGT